MSRAGGRGCTSCPVRGGRSYPPPSCPRLAGGVGILVPTGRMELGLWRFAPITHCCFPSLCLSPTSKVAFSCILIKWYSGGVTYTILISLDILRLPLWPMHGQHESMIQRPLKEMHSFLFNQGYLVHFEHKYFTYVLFLQQYKKVKMN